MMAQRPILVLGAGSWGTALSLVLIRNGQTVWLWDKYAQQIAQMQTTRCNTRYLPNVSLPDELRLLATLDETIMQVHDIIIAVPSHGFRETLQMLKPFLHRHSRLCWATKGLEDASGLLLHTVAEAVIGRTYPKAVLSGPSFATEVAQDLPTAVTVASDSMDYANDLVNLFHHLHFRAYTSTDVIGVELGGAVKNVMAIAAGIADGLGFGANTRAALITRGLTEMVRFGTALGGHLETFMGLAGVGDLVLTCTDRQSRNYRFGYALGQDKTIQQAQDEINQVVEGINTAHQVCRLSKQMNIEMPIARQVTNVLQGICTPKEAVVTLLMREPKKEFA